MTGSWRSSWGSEPIFAAKTADAMAKDRKSLAILTAVGCFLFFLANGNIPMTDPVESNYAQTAKEMLLSGDYVSPRIFGNFWYDKPAFFYWELIAAFKVFGMNDFAARFFPAVFGILGLWMTYFFARKLYGSKSALMSGLILSTSLGYWILSKTVITDMTLFVFFDGVLVFFYLAYSGKRKSLYYLCYVFAGLAVLTKGPIGILLPGLIVTIFLMARRSFSEVLRMRPLGFLLFFLVAASWYYPMYLIHGRAFTDTFLGVHNVLRATVSEHPMWDVWWYYSVLFFIIFFPWAFVTLVPKLREIIRERVLPRLDEKELFLLIWAVTIHVFYQNMATKYSTYTMPAMMPVSILAARYLGARMRTFCVTFIGAVIFLVCVCLFVIVPETNHSGHSGKGVASFLRENVREGDLVLSFDDYRVSRVYYSGLDIYQAETKNVIESSRPDGVSWNSKNVMPYWATEDVPTDRRVWLILGKKRYRSFRDNFDGGRGWEQVRDFAACRIYLRDGGG